MRYKKNVCTIDHGIDKVLKLRSVYFDWDTLSSPIFRSQSGRQIGLIAQETEKIVPEVVYTDEKGYKSIDYSKLSALLVDAVQEQQDIINSQRSELLSQREMIDKLNARLEKLEALAQ